MTEPAREPGWYDDPFGRLKSRWWDGSQWTGYAADTAVQWDEVAEGEPQSPSPRGLGVAVVGYLAGIALAFVAGLLLRDADRVVEVTVSQLGLWAGLIGACVYVSRRRGSGTLTRDFGWRMERIDIGLGFAGAIVGRVVAAILIAPVAASFRDVRAPDRDVFERVADDTTGWIALVLIVCIGAPLVEELFFRGLLQTRLVDVAGTAGGVVIASALFGAAHLLAWEGTITLIYGLGIAGGGLVLGLMRQLSGRLGPSIWAHAFFNAQAVIAVALLT